MADLSTLTSLHTGGPLECNIFLCLWASHRFPRELRNCLRNNFYKHFQVKGNVPQVMQQHLSNLKVTVVCLSFISIFCFKYSVVAGVWRTGK